MKLKDKKIEILAVTHTITPEGFANETLTVVCSSAWAYFRHLSGKEYYSANAEQVQEEVLFQVNYRSDLTTRHVIRYNGVLWDITRIDNYEGRKEDLKLYCKRRA